jgi:hypothetical protein
MLFGDMVDITRTIHKMSEYEQLAGNSGGGGGGIAYESFCTTDSDVGPGLDTASFFAESITDFNMVPVQQMEWEQKVHYGEDVPMYGATSKRASKISAFTSMWNGKGLNVVVMGTGSSTNAAERGPALDSSGKPRFGNFKIKDGANMGEHAPKGGWGRDVARGEGVEGDTVRMLGSNRLAVIKRVHHPSKHQKGGTYDVKYLDRKCDKWCDKKKLSGGFTNAYAEASCGKCTASCVFSDCRLESGHGLHEESVVKAISDIVHSKAGSLFNTELANGSWESQIHTGLPSSSSGRGDLGFGFGYGTGSTSGPRTTPLLLDWTDQAMLFETPRWRMPEAEKRLAEKQQKAQVNNCGDRKKDKDKRLSNAYANNSTLASTNFGGDGPGVEDRRQTHRLDPATHSELAAKKSACKAELSRNQLRHFHRPRLNKLAQMKDAKPFPRFTLQVLPPSQPSETTVQIQTRNKLMMNGELVLCEYTEERPVMLPNIGMASKVYNMWRTNSDTSPPPPPRHGEVKYLKNSEQSPFLGDIPAKIKNFRRYLYNRMYSCPMYEHQSSKTHTDFLLLRTTNVLKGEPFFYIRDLKGVPVFTLGQQEPNAAQKGLVHTNNSAKSLSFSKAYICLHIYRLFMKERKQTFAKHNMACPPLTGSSDDWAGISLRLHDVEKIFKTNTATQRRSQMKIVADPDGAVWHLKDSIEENELAAKFTAEDVCLYESRMMGDQRLIDYGFTNTEAGKKSRKLGYEEANNILKRHQDRYYSHYIAFMTFHPLCICCISVICNPFYVIRCMSSVISNLRYPIRNILFTLHLACLVPSMALHPFVTLHLGSIYERACWGRPSNGASKDRSERTSGGR